MVLLVAPAWAVMTIGCWIGYQLIQQNGHILIHLVSLQQQLANLKRCSAQPVVVPPPMPAGHDIGN
jgi:hypothetical protein